MPDFNKAINLICRKQLLAWALNFFFQLKTYFQLKVHNNKYLVLLTIWGTIISKTKVALTNYHEKLTMLKFYGNEVKVLGIREANDKF